MQQLSLENFLKDRCCFKENVVADVLFTLSEQGIDNVEILFDLTIEDLIGINLGKIQSACIINKLKLLREQPQQHVQDPQTAPPQVDSVNELLNSSNQKIQDPLKIQEKEEPIDNSSISDEKVQIPYLIRPTASKGLFSPSIMSIREEDMSIDNNQCVLFESFEDVGSEYKMSKIRLNEAHFRNLSKMIQENDIVAPVAFYGDFQGCIAASNEYLGICIPLREQEVQEGIFVFKNGIKLALIYKAQSNEIFDYKNEAADHAHLASTYLRFLIDLCHMIVIIPPIDFKMNPDSSNPFQVSCNDPFDLKEEIIVPDEKAQIKKIPYAGEVSYLLDLKQVANSFDQSKFLPIIQSTRDQVENIIKQHLSTHQIYGTKTNQTTSGQYSYDDLKALIIEHWCQEETFFIGALHQRTFEEKIKILLSPYVPPPKLQQLASKHLDSYVKKSQIIKDQKLSKEVAYPLYQQFLDITSSYNCQQFQEHLLQLQKKTKDQSYWQSIKSSVKSAVINIFTGDQKKLECQSKCINNTFDAFMMANKERYRDINWVDFSDFQKKQSVFNQISVHHTFESEQRNLLEKLRQQSQTIKSSHTQQKLEELVGLRKAILQEFFSECDGFVTKSKIFFQSNFTITFQKINIVRDINHKIDSWNMTKDSIVLKNEIKHQNPDIKIKDVFFTGDNSGLLLFENHPENKNSIHYFSAANKSQIAISLLINLSSTDSNLIVEPQQKQWCTFDNSEKRVCIGKFSKDGKIEDGAPIVVYDQMTDGSKISSIKSACFLPQGDRIFILNQENTLFQFQWQSRQLAVIFKKINEDKPGVSSATGVRKIQIKPQDPENSYEQVQATPDGKFIILLGKNILDIYDLNWDLTQSFPLREDFAFIKTFTDKINNFIVIFTSNDYQCYQLVGLTATIQITAQIKEINTRQEILGNPIFDHFYHSFKKYGPHSDFIFAPSSTKIYFYENQANQISEKSIVKNYFNQLKIQNTKIKIINKFEKVFEKEIQSIRAKYFLMIAISRVSMHLATIENSTLVPLNNGKNITDQITENLINSDQKTDMIQRITNFINFGIYEELLSSLNNKIVKVVSIVGRQSSGKSYVMNRLFGTRFNVAATRCTDGVWMSVVQINNSSNEPEIFMILDCEGLFSARRNEQEEMKLCLALSAVSDIMILNQDLSFNRYLNSLFDSFSRSIGRIKGKQLFKGILMMLIRDIVKEDSKGAYQELESNIRQLQGTGNKTFLGAVFGGRLISQCLNFFQMPIFDQEIESCRKLFLKEINKDRWMNGSDLVESLKIVLAQVFSDDDTDIDVHKIKISCEHAFNQALDMFYNGGKRFKETQIIKDVDIGSIKYQITAYQREIVLEKEAVQDKNDLEQTFPLAEEILNSFIRNSVKHQTNIHDDWIKSFGSFVKDLLIQRKDYTLNNFREQLPKDQEFDDVISTYLLKLKNIFEIYISKLLFCDKTCRSCKRTCALRLNHTNNCECETNHICQEPCQRSEECKNSQNLCVAVFGHDQQHRCGEGNHKCSSRCEKLDCIYLCSIDAGHDSIYSHDCGNRHPCKAECEDDNCKKTCQYDSSFDHDSHTCGESKCNNKCLFCHRQCIFPNHLHSKLIQEGKISELNHQPSDAPNTILFDYHICEEEHSCKEKCEQAGVCSIDYKSFKERQWVNEFGSFPYIYFEPQDTRLECNIRIKKYLKSHKSNHNCKISSGHRCSNQCPECKSFCSKDMHHAGMHESKNHRNKENNVFVTSSGKQSIQIIEEGGLKKKFKPGESCSAENCTQSCSRKGRAHYHLKECTSLKDCIALNGSQKEHVRHADEKFHPKVDKVFDKWLCKSYWNSINWEPPIEGKSLELAALCNYACAHRSHKNNDYKYCVGSAWHSGPHIFDCDHKTGSPKIIDIVFCMDTTASMSSYIQKSKDAVRKIIEGINGLPSTGERSIKFGFVAYRDHPPEEETYVTKCQALTNESVIQSFIDSLTASGGGDAPESVLDGLHFSINQCGYRENAIKFLFHIGDAPPHGRIYTGGLKDKWPEGCPCGIKIETLAAQMKTQNIRYKLLKIGSYLNSMAAEFKKHIENFEETDLDSAESLDLKMSEILVREIRQEDDDVIMT